jgi:hypothetical protein
MNREPLSMLLISQGDMYANDALQTICERIYNYKNNDFLNFQGRCFEDTSLYDTQEYKDFAKGLNNSINLFNTIVGLGKDEALDFIKANWLQFIGYPYKTDKDERAKEVSRILMSFKRIRKHE